MWYRLDNAAKIFPASKSKVNSSVFRVAFIVKEEVEENVLQQATNDILPRFPLFIVRHHAGLFWSHFHTNKAPFIIKKEAGYPCQPISFKSENGYLFRILYFKKRIAVEMFHALTDGYGAIELLKALVFRYLTLKGIKINTEGKIMTAEEMPSILEAGDSYMEYSQKNITKIPSVAQKAYQIRGFTFPQGGTNVSHGVIDVIELKTLAKKKGVSLTIYLTAMLFYALHLQLFSTKRPLVITVPVNLRKIFPSKTLRNFFATVNIAMPLGVKQFDVMLSIVKKELHTSIQKAALQQKITEYVQLEKRFIVRLVPEFIKRWLMRISFTYWSEQSKTLTLTNLGNIDLPSKMNEQIEHMETIMYPTKQSPINAAVCSVNQSLTITFANAIPEKITEQFFTLLEKEVQVERYNNSWEEEN